MGHTNKGIYTRYVGNRYDKFLEILETLNSAIDILIDYDIVSPNTQLRARIKSLESAKANGPIKTLDDLFGIEIVANNESEVAEFEKLINKRLLVKKQTYPNKKNGYKATHFIITTKEPRKGKTVPVIEIQIKTKEVKELEGVGKTADHLKYKSEIPEDIQRKFDNMEFNENNIPKMWKRVKGKIIPLTKLETLQNIYPFLKIKKLSLEERE